MNTEGVIIKASNIDGKGIFATRDFKQGEIVLRWNTSTVLDPKNVDMLSDEEKKYITVVNGQYTKMQEPEKFVNHSCEPNTYVQDFCDVALRYILEGEEITSDYTDSLAPNTVMQCNCGSKDCKKVIEKGPMKLLVATRNKDKFNLVKLLFESIAPDIRLVPLFDIEISDDMVEDGSIEERAIQKAKFFFSKLQNIEDGDQFDGVLGTDDGIQIGDQVPSPNSKELTDSILEEKYSKGTSIGIVRAFAFITKEGILRSTQSVIPFIFLGNENGVTRSEGQYPLSKVLAPLGMDVPFSQLSDEESNTFMLEYSKEGLTEILVDL